METPYERRLQNYVIWLAIILWIFFSFVLVFFFYFNPTTMIDIKIPAWINFFTGYFYAIGIFFIGLEIFYLLNEFMKWLEKKNKKREFYNHLKRKRNR